jgi:hypothetical protein
LSQLLIKHKAGKNTIAPAGAGKIYGASETKARYLVDKSFFFQIRH